MKINLKVRAALIFCSSIFVFSFFGVEGAYGDESKSYQKQIIEKVRTELIGAHLLSDVLKEDYPEQGYYVESTREARFVNFLGDENGFQFDLHLSATHQKVLTKDGKEVREPKTSLTAVWRTQVRPLDEIESYVGTTISVSSSFKENVLGRSSSIVMNIEDGKLKSVETDIHPRFDKNDKKFCTSDTISTVYQEDGRTKMDIKYLEFGVDLKTGKRTNQRQDADLHYISPK